MYEIKHNPKGYYTLTIDGEFQGNFDTVEEAVNEASELIYNLVSI